jgi:hypothetical protein
MKTTDIPAEKPAPEKPTLRCAHRWFYDETDDEGTGWQKSYKHACEHCGAVDYFSTRVRD